jgi:hypothetical protein
VVALFFAQKARVSPLAFALLSHYGRKMKRPSKSKRRLRRLRWLRGSQGETLGLILPAAR